MGCLMLVDGGGRRYLVPEGNGIIRVLGLGVLDRDILSNIEPGCRVSIAGRKFTLLRPTLSDMMLSIERGPQVITEKDGALIAHFIDLRCGSTVLELGAGSGSLSLLLLHGVGSKGSVVTVDNRLEHLRLAGSNIERFGLGCSWHPVLADARKHLGVSFADAACMDIPDPWNALDACWSALRPGCMLASYSPTVNQIERTVTEAISKSFTHELSFELIMRKISVSPGATRHSFEGPGHTGYVSLFRKVNADK